MSQNNPVSDDSALENLNQSGEDRQNIAEQVSTLELFFDLVFVFTLTQLTHLLAGELSLVNIAHVLLIFGVSWWMYGGYAWLTNHLPPNSPPQRLLLLLGMSAFLVLALAIPHAFGEAGLTFGLAYLAAILVHTSLFLQATKAITPIAVFNVISALLVIGAGFVHGGPLDYGLWILAMVLQFITPYLGGVSDFRIQPSHFVERHGLLMIVAFGESVVAVGIGASGLPLEPGLIAAAVLGLALVSCLWWTYFVGDSDRAEERLFDATVEQRSKLAVNGYFYAHIPMLLGVVFIAVGMESAIEHAFEPLGPGPATALAGGAALYLGGNVAFRKILSIGSVTPRIIAVFLTLGTIPLGIMSAVIQLTALIILFIVVLLKEGSNRISTHH